MPACARYRLLILGGAAIWATCAQPLAAGEFRFRAQQLTDKLGIGYAVTIADLNEDGKSDIVVVDTNRVIWFENPTWREHTLIQDQTKKDNVCIAPYDIDGDGKLDFALGADWRPIDTRSGGTIQWLSRGKPLDDRWTVHPIGEEPTVHRMHWVKESPDKYFLAVLPLHGCNNVNTEGDGIRFLGYRPEKDKEWPTFLINDQFHLAHNFDPVTWPGGAS